jgi:hypothetical protein
MIISLELQPSIVFLDRLVRLVFAAWMVWVWLSLKHENYSCYLSTVSDNELHKSSMFYRLISYGNIYFESCL